MTHAAKTEKNLTLAICLALSMSSSHAQFGAVLNLSDINGINGFVINGVSEIDRSGVSVSNAGDVNGDGMDDLIIGANYASPNDRTEAGSSYVVFGSDLIFTNDFEIKNL